MPTQLFLSLQRLVPAVALLLPAGAACAQWPGPGTPAAQAPLANNIKPSDLPPPNATAVLRFTYKSGQTKAEGAPEKIADLPGKGYRERPTFLL